VQEVETIVEEERRVAEDARQALVLLEKKRISLQTEVDDLHAALENVRTSLVNLFVLLGSTCTSQFLNVPENTKIFRPRLSPHFLVTKQANQSICLVPVT